MTDPRLERWLEALPRRARPHGRPEPDRARRVHLDDALAAARCRGRPIVDVGSGARSPGFPVASARPASVDLLEAQRRRCAFLDAAAVAFPNVAVVCARAEEHGRDVGRKAYAVAWLKRAPPVALGGHLRSCGAAAASCC